MRLGRAHADTTDIHAGRPSRRAFTLVEMIVVVGVILIILGLTLPSMTTLWDERKVAEAENTIQGLIMSTRGKALLPLEGESGIFFYIDKDGVQRIVPIRQVDSGHGAFTKVFEVSPERDYSLPPPMRVVPRYVVDEPDQAAPWLDFSAEELANNFFEAPPSTGQSAQRHRNFFTLIYSVDGKVVPRRDVLIRDEDDDGDGIGDITSLNVAPPSVNYYKLDDTGVPLDAAGGGSVDWLVSDGQAAINFPSVDGVLVYDDALFNDVASGGGSDTVQRDFLLELAKPFYINRYTGGVIRGPAGESVAP